MSEVKLKWLGRIEKKVLRKELVSEERMNFFQWDFLRVWHELGYDTLFKESQDDFLYRIEHSLDALAMLTHVIRQYTPAAFDTGGHSPIEAGEEIGYNLALTGENPPITDIIFNLRYNFDSGHYESNDEKNLEQRIKTELLQNPFTYKFKRLHGVCKGYLRARIVYFLKTQKQALEKQNKVAETPSVFKDNGVKLKWKLRKNQLYYILRQLKNDHDALGNSYNELAEFLIDNVVGFENVKKETIEKELKKDKPLPKDKRIAIHSTEI